MRPRTWTFWLAMALLAAVVPTGARAEDIEKKLRLGASIGANMPVDKIHSASANSRALFDQNNVLIDFIDDPRNDSAAISDFGVRAQFGASLYLQYAFTPIWYIEGLAGYNRGDVSNVEVQAQFNGTPSSNLQDFQFQIFNLPAGQVQQIPLQLSMGVRFRPKAAFSPYLMLGAGYSFNSFHPSHELNQLSLNLDNSVGGFARLVGTRFGGSSFVDPTTFGDLTGISVDLKSAPEFHFGGGFEVPFAKRWVVFLDARYLTYSGHLKIRINGSNELGISVPADRATLGTPGALGPFGAFLIPTGGLIDGGSLVPAPNAPPGTDCKVSPLSCQFTGPRDGIPDPGYYYIHAGDVRLDGLTLHAGVKFTF